MPGIFLVVKRKEKLIYYIADNLLLSVLCRYGEKYAGILKSVYSSVRLTISLAKRINPLCSGSFNALNNGCFYTLLSRRLLCLRKSCLLWLVYAY